MKMFVKYLKFWANNLKIWKKGVQRCLILSNGRPGWGESHEDLFCGGHPKIDLCGRKYSHKELPEKFSGKFGEIRAKIFRNPKNLPAPTPMGDCLSLLKFLATRLAQTHRTQGHRNVYEQHKEFVGRCVTRRHTDAEDEQRLKQNTSKYCIL